MRESTMSQKNRHQKTRGSTADFLLSALLLIGVAAAILIPLYAWFPRISA